MVLGIDAVSDEHSAFEGGGGRPRSGEGSGFGGNLDLGIVRIRKLRISILGIPPLPFLFAISTASLCSVNTSSHSRSH